MKTKNLNFLKLKVLSVEHLLKIRGGNCPPEKKGQVDPPTKP
jgi:hypothetical protein